MSELVKDWYKPGEIGKLLGVSARTILNYNDRGLITMQLDLNTNRWYASKEEVSRLLYSKGIFFDDTNVAKKDIIYARVSSHDQKKNGDLDRQIQYLQEYILSHSHNVVSTYSDVGSGLNSERPGLLKLMNEVMQGNVNNVYITYKDRLTRFGFSYLELFFKHFGTGIVVINQDVDKSEQEELVEDMMSLIASFSGKLYGIRSSKKRQLKKYIDDLEVED